MVSHVSWLPQSLGCERTFSAPAHSHKGTRVTRRQTSTLHVRSYKFQYIHVNYIGMYFLVFTILQYFTVDLYIV